MITEDNGGSAFPSQAGYDFKGERVTTTNEGMTLRDYFAAKSLPACFADTCQECVNSGFPEDWKMGVALEAYAMADAMLEARKK